MQINDSTGKPYLTLSDAGDMIKIQLHTYDDIGPHYLTLDKRSLPELIYALEQYEPY
jgi:hypothetical protein